MYKTLLVLLSLGVLVLGDNHVFAKDINYGQIQSGLYTNDYFNMSIQLPETWVIQSQAQQKALMKSGMKMLSGDDANLEKVLKASEKQTLNMFSVFKFEHGAPVEFNPSLIGVAERVANMPGIKRGADYHFHVKNVLRSGQMRYEFPEEIYTEKLSGSDFDVMSSTLKVGKNKIYQKFYAAKSKDYILTFIISYTNESDKAELQSILKTLKLK